MGPIWSVNSEHKKIVRPIILTRRWSTLTLKIPFYSKNPGKFPEYIDHSKLEEDAIALHFSANYPSKN